MLLTETREDPVIMCNVAIFIPSAQSAPDEVAAPDGDATLDSDVNSSSEFSLNGAFRPSYTHVFRSYIHPCSCPRLTSKLLCWFLGLVLSLM